MISNLLLSKNTTESVINVKLLYPKDDITSLDLTNFSLDFNCKFFYIKKPTSPMFLGIILGY
jgi:hypothetical protein